MYYRNRHRFKMRTTAAILFTVLAASSSAIRLQSGIATLDAPASEGEDGKAVIVSNQLCLNRCVARKENMCRWITKNPAKKANCIQRCRRECIVCPLSTISSVCAKGCETKCTGNVACLHSCMEQCPCEDVSHEIHTLVSLFPDAEEATHLSTNPKKHFMKGKKATEDKVSGDSKTVAPKTSEKKTKEGSPSGSSSLGYPIHFMPSATHHLSKGPKSKFLKMIKVASKASRAMAEKAKGEDSEKAADKLEEEAEVAKATGDSTKAAKLEKEAKGMKLVAKEAAAKGDMAASRSEDAAGDAAGKEEKALKEEEEANVELKKANEVAASGDKKKAQSMIAAAQVKKSKAKKAESAANAEAKANAETAYDEAEAAAVEAEKKASEAEDKLDEKVVAKLKEEATEKRVIADKMKEESKEADSVDSVAQEEGKAMKAEAGEKLAGVEKLRAQAEIANQQGNITKHAALVKELDKAEMEAAQSQAEAIEGAIEASSGKLSAEALTLEKALATARKGGDVALAQKLDRKQKTLQVAAEDEKLSSSISAKGAAILAASKKLEGEAEKAKERNETSLADALLASAKEKAIEAQQMQLKAQSSMVARGILKKEKAIEILSEKLNERSDDKDFADAIKSEIAKIRKQLVADKDVSKEANATEGLADSVKTLKDRIEEAIVKKEPEKDIADMKAELKSEEEKATKDMAAAMKKISSSEDSVDKQDESATSAGTEMEKKMQLVKTSGNETEAKEMENKRAEVEAIVDDAMQGIRPATMATGTGESARWWKKWNRNDTSSLHTLVDKMVDEVQNKDPGLVKVSVEKSNSHHAEALDHYNDWKSGGATGSEAGATGVIEKNNSKVEPFRKIKGERKPGMSGPAAEEQ